MNITIILLICGCIVTLTSGISIYLFLKNKKIKNQNNVLNTQLKDFNSRINPLQLEVLEAKLNPHLFKNILNSIQSHAYKTYFAIDRLSNVPPVGRRLAVLSSAKSPDFVVLKARLLPCI